MRKVTTAFIAIAILAGVLVPAAAQEESTKAKAPDLKIGQSVYTSKCAFCHGEKGDGQGPSGKFLKPPPGNFIDTEWIHGGEMEDLVKTIKEGVKGTAMVGFANTLTEDEIRSVAAYVKQFSAGNEGTAKEAQPEGEGQESHERHEEQP